MDADQKKPRHTGVGKLGLRKQGFDPKSRLIQSKKKLANKTRKLTAAAAAGAGAGAGGQGVLNKPATRFTGSRKTVKATSRRPKTVSLTRQNVVNFATSHGLSRKPMKVVASMKFKSNARQSKARNPGSYKTIYDFVIAVHNDPRILINPNAQKLYDDIALYLVCFSMADLCHDFRDLNVNLNLDGKAGKMSIGNYYRERACEAFSHHSNMETLKTVTGTEFIKKMGSDGKAKKFIANMMTDFFIKIKYDIYAKFIDTNSYNLLFDSCAKLRNLPYDDDVKQKYIINSMGGSTNLAILVDSQTGNPLRDLFKCAPYLTDPTKRPNYYTNFATILDPSPNPKIGVHEYLNIFVQTAGLPKTFSEVDGIYNIKHTIDKLIYNQAGWNITSQFHGYGPETINSANKVSVNNQGLFKSRFFGQKPAGAGAGAGGAAPAAAVPTIDVVCLDHHLKSCGDRYQGYSFSKINNIDKTIKYSEYTQLQTTKLAETVNQKAFGSSIIDPKKNKVIFTTDYLLARQLYGMRVNSLYSGVKKLSYFEFDEEYKTAAAAPRAALAAEPVVSTPESVIDDIFKNKDTIAEEIDKLDNYDINYSTIDSFTKSIFEATENKKAFEYCQTLPILKDFAEGKAITKDTLKLHISKKNFKQYKFIADNSAKLAETLKIMTRESAGSQDDFVNSVKTNLSECLNNMDMSLIGMHGSITDKIVSDYLKTVGILIENININLSDFYIENYTQMLAHLIILNHNKRRINKILYKDGLLYKYFNGISRTSPIYKAYILSREYYFAPEQYDSIDSFFKIVLMAIVKMIDEYKPTRPDLRPAVYSYCRELDAELERYEKYFSTALDSLKETFNADMTDRCRQIYASLNTWFSASLTFKIIGMCMTIDKAIELLYDDILDHNGLNVAAKAVPESEPEEPTELQKAFVPFHKGIIKEKLAFVEVLEDRFVHTKKPNAEIEKLISAVPIPAAAPPTLSLFTNLKYIFKHAVDFVEGINYKITALFSAVMIGGRQSRAHLSRSRTPKNKFLELIPLKIQYMECGLFDAAYHGISYVNSSYTGLGLVAKSKLLNVRKSRPVVFAVQKGGVLTRRSRTRSGTRKKQRSRIIFAQGSRADPLSKEHSKSNGPKIITNANALETLRKQMVAFFFLGFNNEEADVKILQKHLPDFANIDMSRVHGQLFWMPFVEQTTASYEQLELAYKNAIAYLSGEELPFAPENTKLLENIHSRVASQSENLKLLTDSKAPLTSNQPRSRKSGSRKSGSRKSRSKTRKYVPINLGGPQTRKISSKGAHSSDLLSQKGLTRSEIQELRHDASVDLY